jgi:protein gp37
MTSDFFLEEADEWRADVWPMIKARPDLRFWLQTKRAERVRECLPSDWENGYDNVSMCFTTENQRRADERLPILIELPFSEKNIMCAPMIGEITLEKYLATGEFSKVLVDGENYDGDRPLHYEWVKRLYDECLRYGVSFDFVGVGNYFIKDGRTYHTPKAYQHVSALRSGMQIPAVDTDIPIQLRCRTCKRRDSCNGCKWCGKCR